MLESCTVSAIIPASPQRIYEMWLDSDGHSALTGGSVAVVDPTIGGHFIAWDGYIKGTTLELEPYRRIVQAWRTSDFPPESADSHLEVLLEPVEGGTKMTFIHTDIPAGQAREYEQGWTDYYITPMTAYFSQEEP